MPIVQYLFSLFEENWFLNTIQKRIKDINVISYLKKINSSWEHSAFNHI
jgi:hypothetical protein